MEITIQKYEDKTSQKNGKKYTRFLTSEGWVSVFENDVIKALKEAEGRVCDVNLVSNGDFKNIRGFNQYVDKPQDDTFAGAKVTKEKTESKHKTMYISYVKDLVVSGMEIEKAIEVIKKAQKSFE